jgi:spermidine synthase
MPRFGLTIFLSAFLLFQVQPLIGKAILPWFGGGPAVWTACLLFFQLTLLIGYGYAHVISSRLSPRAQSSLHLSLLAVSLFLLPITPSAELWKPGPDDLPTRQILLLLVGTIGIPYLLLSSTAPLIQRWFSAAYPVRSPYRLYALSNIGSLLALLSYPVLVEPWLALRNQAVVWSWGYAGFVVCSAWVLLQARFWNPLKSTVAPGPRDSSPAPAASLGHPAGGDPPRAASALLWLGLSAVASALLLATTNQMCQEVAVVPFLWVLPLAIYLLTFIICFDDERRYDRRWFGILLGVAAPVALMLIALGLRVPLVYQVAIYSLALFAGCMCCHGELVKSKPHPEHLTAFYFFVAAGGALGGALVALLAPRVFSGLMEYPLALAGCAVLTLLAWYRARAWEPYLERPYWIMAPVTALMFVVVIPLFLSPASSKQESVLRSRSFYGVLRLTEQTGEYGTKRVLTHGTVIHGSQFVGEEKRSWPTTYYGHESGVGLAMKHHPRRQAQEEAGRSLRVGVVGLGAGTIAALAGTGDYIRFYEINPEVIRIADEYFTFLRDTPASVDVIPGDARIRMESELARGQHQNFDILVVDAFSSGAVPIHLLTRECIDTYWQHLKPDGLLLFHISNRVLNLEPVVRGLAAHCECEVRLVSSAGDDAAGVSQATWMVLTKNKAFLQAPEITLAVTRPSTMQPSPLLWTDDFASLWRVLKF